MQEIPPIRFFDPHEANLMEVVAAHLLPQDDRMPSQRIPIVPSIDERLHEGRIPGYRFATMPPTAMLIGSAFKPLRRSPLNLMAEPFSSFPGASRTSF